MFFFEELSINDIELSMLFQAFSILLKGLITNIVIISINSILLCLLYYLGYLETTY